MTDIQQFERTADGLLVRAPAKLNLSLLIAGKRPDGFHEIETIMVKIDWYDEVLIQPGQHGVELTCEGPEWAPQSRDNLVYRAAELILRHAGRTESLRLTLTKNVPAGTGLGSASSDAAATLMGVNKHLGLGLSTAALAGLAAQLGSDVAFFLDGPQAFCTGRGEKLEELTQRFDFAAVLILPPVNVSTKDVYAHYAHDASLYEQCSRQINAYRHEKRVDLIAKMGANMLQRACFHLFEKLDKLKQTIESLGVGAVCLSGSGSAMYFIADDRTDENLEKQRREVADKTGCRTRIVRANGW